MKKNAFLLRKTKMGNAEVLLSLLLGNCGTAGDKNTPIFLSFRYQRLENYKDSLKLF